MANVAREQRIALRAAMPPPHGLQFGRLQPVNRTVSAWPTRRCAQHRRRFGGSRGVRVNSKASSLRMRFGGCGTGARRPGGRASRRTAPTQFRRSSRPRSRPHPVGTVDQPQPADLDVLGGRDQYVEHRGNFPGAAAEFGLVRMEDGVAFLSAPHRRDGRPYRSVRRFAQIEEMPAAALHLAGPRKGKPPDRAAPCRSPRSASPAGRCPAGAGAARGPPPAAPGRGMLALSAKAGAGGSMRSISTGSSQGIRSLSSSSTVWTASVGMEPADENIIEQRVGDRGVPIP